MGQRPRLGNVIMFAFDDSIIRFFSSPFYEKEKKKLYKSIISAWLYRLVTVQ